MKKRILSLLCAAMILTMTALPASAQTTGSESQNLTEPPATSSSVDGVEATDGFTLSVADGVKAQSDSGPTEVQRDAMDESTVSAIGIYPFEIQYTNHNGAPVIIKSFKVPAGYNPDLLVEDEFTEDGFIYTKKDVLMKEPELITEGKTVAEAINFTTEKDDQATLLAAITPVIDYRQGGYSGQLVLDYASIMSTVADEEAYSYPIRRTVEVNNLGDNDYAYLDKNMNGLTLVSADWNLQNGVQRAENMIPGQYTAHATYTGTGYGTRATGYTNTAYYTGYVTRTFEGDAVYSIVYKGIQDPTTIITKAPIPWAGIFTIFGLTLLIAGAGWFLIFKVIPAIRNRGNGGDGPPVQVPD